MSRAQLEERILLLLSFMFCCQHPNLGLVGDVPPCLLIYPHTSWNWIKPANLMSLTLFQGASPSMVCCLDPKVALQKHILYLERGVLLSHATTLYNKDLDYQYIEMSNHCFPSPKISTFAFTFNYVVACPTFSLVVDKDINAQVLQRAHRFDNFHLASETRLNLQLLCLSHHKFGFHYIY